MGQNDQFPPDKLSDGCGLTKQTFAGMVARRKMRREQPFLPLAARIGSVRHCRTPTLLAGAISGYKR